MRSVSAASESRPRQSRSHHTQRSAASRSRPRQPRSRLAQRFGGLPIPATPTTVTPHAALPRPPDPGHANHGHATRHVCTASATRPPTRRGRLVCATRRTWSRCAWVTSATRPPAASFFSRHARRPQLRAASARPPPRDRPHRWVVLARVHVVPGHTPRLRDLRPHNRLPRRVVLASDARYPTSPCCSSPSAARRPTLPSCSSLHRSGVAPP